MSWTSSFLFAVQHAIRRRATDRSDSGPESIHIWILDTRKLPRGSFLPAVALLKAYDVEDIGKLKHGCYHGEYLSQGSMGLTLSDAMQTTTLKSLVDYGLYKLYPPFADENYQRGLFLRVLQLRETFLGLPERPSADEISMASRITVGCFPSINIRPIAMMVLLSLKPQYRLDMEIMEAFRKNHWGMRSSQMSTLQG